MAVFIEFAAINISCFRNNSKLLSGENVQIGLDDFAKANVPVGEIQGLANFVPCQVNIVNDLDVIDTVMNNSGVTGSAGPAILKFT